MRRLIFLLVLFVGYIAHAGTLTHNVSFDPSLFRYDTVVTNTTQYIRINYDGIDHLSKPGVPELPAKYVRLVVPYNATNITVSCSYLGRRTITVGSKVVPVEQPQVADETATETPILIEDSLIYNTPNLYPSSLGEIVSDGFFMGENHVITIALYPVRYNPVSGVATIFSNINATISYDISSNQGNILVRNSAESRLKDQIDLIGIVDNPNQIASFSPQIYGPSLAPDNGNLGIKNYEYNIITTRALEPAYKRLIALKRQKGYSAGTICVEDIMQNPLVNGGDVNKDSLGNVVSVFADSAGIIRAYLKKIYNGKGRFLLMGGKAVPFRYGKAQKEHIVPTDFYYSELNTAWDSETDSITGNTTIIPRPNVNNVSSVDYNAEYYVGRLLGNSYDDINNYTSKLYRYELNPGNGDFSYLKRALYFEYRDMHDCNEVDSVSEIANSVFSGNNGYLIDTGIEANMIKGSDIINMINTNQYGMIDLHGHGTPASIGTHSHKDGAHKHILRAYENVPLSPGHIYDDPGSSLDCLNNKYYPNILYSISCTTMPFDIYTSYKFTPPHVYNIERNFGDSFISGKDYGGVAFLSNTREGYYGSLRCSVGLECEFFRCINAGYTHIGKAESLSKANFNKNGTNTYYALVHNLLGDPEFQMWTNIPTYYQNLSISRTNNSITVSGINDNDSKVVYCDATSQQTQIAQSGSVTFQNVSPNGSIMVYKDNKIPYIADMAIQNDIISDSRYVVANNVEVGANLDSNRTFGNVTITNGAEYEIEAKGDVIIRNGFTVEKGAVFGVYPFAY